MVQRMNKLDKVMNHMSFLGFFVFFLFLFFFCNEYKVVNVAKARIKGFVQQLKKVTSSVTQPGDQWFKGLLFSLLAKVGKC